MFIHRHPTTRRYIRKIIDGASYVIRSANPAAKPCCCTGAPLPQYKVRRCSDGAYVGWCVTTPPPYYFHTEGDEFRAGGCLFSAELATPEDVCLSPPVAERVEIDSCAECDPVNFPDDPVDPEPAPNPCPCPGAGVCLTCPTGHAATFRVYVDGVTPKTDCYNGGGGCDVSPHRSAEGAVDGVYQLTHTNGCTWGAESVALTTRYWWSDACDSLMEERSASIRLNDVAVGVSDTNSEVVVSMPINHAFKCCGVNVYTADAGNPCWFASGGSAVAIPCE